MPTDILYKAEHREPYNGIGFSGPSIMVVGKTTVDASIKMPYTGNQYEAISKMEGYGFDAVKFTYLLTVHGTNGMTNYTNELIVSAGEVQTKWTTAWLTVEQFVNAFGRTGDGSVDSDNPRGHYGDPTVKQLVLRADGFAADGYDLYIGELEFVTMPEGAIYTRITNTLDFELSSSNKSNVAINNTSYGTPDYVESVPNQSTYGDVVVDIANDIGFSGPAFTVQQTRVHLAQIYIAFNYSAEQYLTLSKLGYFDTVTFSYMIEIDPSLGLPQAGSSGTPQIFAEAGYGYRQTKLKGNTWVTCTLTAEEFVNSFDNPANKRARLLYSYLFGKSHKYNLYLSGFTFTNSKVAE